jgi:hypothetical protein
LRKVFYDFIFHLSRVKNCTQRYALTMVGDSMIFQPGTKD